MWKRDGRMRGGGVGRGMGRDGDVVCGFKCRG